MREIMSINCIVVKEEDEEDVCIFALCDDGTLWKRWNSWKNKDWIKLPEIPQDK